MLTLRYRIGSQSTGLIILEHELRDYTVDTFMDTWSYAVAAGWTVKSVAELDGTNRPYQNAVGATGKVTSQAVMTGTFYPINALLDLS